MARPYHGCHSLSVSLDSLKAPTSFSDYILSACSRLTHTSPPRTLSSISTDRRLQTALLVGEALALMALAEGVVAAAAAVRVVQEDALGGWTIFEDRNVAAVNKGIILGFSG